MRSQTILGLSFQFSKHKEEKKRISSKIDNLKDAPSKKMMKLSFILKKNQTMSVKQIAAGSGMGVIADGVGETSMETCLPSPPWTSVFAVHTQVICYVVSLDRSNIWD